LHNPEPDLATNLPPHQKKAVLEQTDERTALLIGQTGLARLAKARVLVAGLGGVGGICAEMLARAGVGRIDLLDGDTFVYSNLNRQILATYQSIGQTKAETARARLMSIRSDLTLVSHTKFLAAEEVGDFLHQIQPDWVADCIDTVTTKSELLIQARQNGIHTFTALGAGNRTDPTAIRSGMLGDVVGCGLARVLRQRLRKAGMTLDFPVVYSNQPPKKPAPHERNEAGIRPRAVNGTISYMPNIFGSMLAGQIIEAILADRGPD